MKKIVFLFVGLALMTACNNNNSKSTETPAAKETSNPALVVFNQLLGSFVGAFGDNKITLLITRAQNDSIEGRTIVGGNDRPFSGLMREKDGVYSVSALEPGDDPNDGAFEFAISAANPDQVKGSWKPFDTKKQSKEYNLLRKPFIYDTSAGLFPEGSQRILKEEDVENLTKDALEQMRNEIFARHGYCFRRKALRQNFEREEWYVPDNVDVRDKLTDTEKKNLALIKRYEQYAEEFGDEFGR